jgi:hypothetical protein
MSLVAPLILCLSLTTGLDQTRPDFSGKWTKIPAAAGEPIQILTITQTQNTLTLDDAGRRWVHKLDGSESKNVMTQDNPPRETVQISTSAWEADTLVTVFPIQGSESPYLLRVATSLDGKTLVVRATSTSQTTGAVLRDQTTRYSK